MARRYRATGSLPSGWGPVAQIHDRETGETFGVYFRLGRWRRFSTDVTVGPKIAAIARRALRGAS